MTEHPPLKTVADLKLPRYLGTWYEIARLDHRFERGLTHVSATYSRNPDGSIHLHARYLEFMHPVRKTPVKITAPPPEDPLWEACMEGS